MKKFKILLFLIIAISTYTNAFARLIIDGKDPIGECDGNFVYNVIPGETITVKTEGNNAFEYVYLNDDNITNSVYTSSYSLKVPESIGLDLNFIKTIYKYYAGGGIYKTDTFICYLQLANYDLPSHVPGKLYIICSSVSRWESSRDGGVTWANIDCQANEYTEQDPEEGTVLYRILQTDGTYSGILTINYYDVVPSDIVAIPATETKTVDESTTFTLDVPDDGYTYQWYHNGVAISGANQNNYSIDTVKSKDAGSYYCEVSNPVSSVNSTAINFTVYKAPQVITFPEIEAKTYGDADFKLPAKTDKGLTIVYQSSNTSVATVNGNTVKIVGVGETNIIASQVGNDDYLEAAHVTRKLVVNKIPQTIIFEELPVKTYEDIPFSLPTVTDKGLTISYESINTDVATVSGNTVTIVGAGTTDIVAKQAGNTYHYAATPVTRTLTVNRRTQNITFAPFAPKVYGDAPIELNQYTDKHLEIVYTTDDDKICSIEGNKITILHPGTAVISATQKGNKNYMPAQEVKQTLTVNKAPQTIVWDEIPNKAYGDPDFLLPAETDKGLTITYSSDNTDVAVVSGNKVSIKGTGSANITGSQAGNDYYNEAASVTRSLTVIKSYQTIEFNELPVMTYGADAISLTAYTNSSSGISYESSDKTVASISGNILTIVGAGKCYITAYANGDNNFYDATPVQREFIVNKADQTIEFPIIADKTYGDDSFALVATSNRGLPISFTSSSPAIVSVDGTTATIKGAGTVVITAKQTGTKNYNEASKQLEVVVNKAVLTATAVNTERYYGDANPKFDISYIGFKNGDTEQDLTDIPVASSVANTASNVGEYDITITEVTDKNYDIIYQTGVLTIKKAPLTVIANDVVKIYGNKNPALSVSYSGFKNEQDETELLNKPTVSTTAKTMSDVGDYPISVEGGEARNYELVYKEGVLTINKASLKIKLLDASREYGTTTDYEILYNGFKGDDDENVLDVLPSVVDESDTYSDVGYYSIYLEGGNDNNYEYTFNYDHYDDSSRMTVRKAPLTIIADDKYKVYLDELPKFTMTFFGFRNNDTAEDIDKWPNISCSATANSSCGQYAIKLTGGSDNNYEFTLQNGTLTIGSASTEDTVLVNSITLSSDNVNIAIGERATLDVIITPTNATNKGVTWSSSNNSVVTVENGVITGVGVGTAIICVETTDGSNLSAYCEVTVGDSSIANLEQDDIAIYEANGSIIIANAPIDSVASVYSTSGVLVASRQVTDLKIEVGIANSGMYIVHIGDIVKKVIVK